MLYTALVHYQIKFQSHSKSHKEIVGLIQYQHVDFSNYLKKQDLAQVSIDDLQQSAHHCMLCLLEAIFQNKQTIRCCASALKFICHLSNVTTNFSRFF